MAAFQNKVRWYITCRPVLYLSHAWLAVEALPLPLTLTLTLPLPLPLPLTLTLTLTLPLTLPLTS